MKNKKIETDFVELKIDGLKDISIKSVLDSHFEYIKKVYNVKKLH